MKHQSKGFTLVELIMVLGVFSVLILTLRNAFQYKQKDILYAEACINKLYGNMNNFSYSAMTSKGLYTGNTTIYPDQYIINLNSSGNILDLNYKSGSNIYNYLRNALSSENMKSYYCTKGYTTKLSGNNMTITISKERTQELNQGSYTLTGGGSLFSGATSFYICMTGSSCKQIAIFEVDTRIQTIKKKLCITIDDTTGLCTKRDQ